MLIGHGAPRSALPAASLVSGRDRGRVGGDRIAKAVIGRLLRELEPQGIVRHRSQEKVLRLRTGAYQAEFLPETLLGERNTACVHPPGIDAIPLSSAARPGWRQVS